LVLIPGHCADRTQFLAVHRGEAVSAASNTLILPNEATVSNGMGLLEIWVIWDESSGIGGKQEESGL
jgi:hypothetical protein